MKKMRLEQSEDQYHHEEKIAGHIDYAMTALRSVKEACGSSSHFKGRSLSDERFASSLVRSDLQYSCWKYKENYPASRAL